MYTLKKQKKQQLILQYIYSGARSDDNTESTDRNNCTLLFVDIHAKQ